MNFPIDSPETLGQVIRAARKALDLRQDDAAGIIGVSENFLGKVERGGETVQWGKLFQVMEQLGLKMSVEVPDAAASAAWENFIRLRNKAAHDIGSTNRGNRS
ncbi:helix-turn-helix domain-containing protein [Pseudomonas sp. LS44]|uniref:helix-turn-helix domain-containing protein n=1 Tax=Pseudomonas sp. LS44 TaxID=1357074 RepID=UPI00215B14E2|nr:helix-turn-helix domain-containing protein [Pseudomonas sp. LS44]UVE19533.1 helix-turn-helix domain-containing protein [Pseudomonas sp. LS44]